ncbi:MAG: NADH-quinone oxidoreductase subunit NuoE [Anaerolineales bacterium]|nr:NADH-quinone oxidoreductase subunit NuoE [Anaerolineales bacterium]
MPVSDQTQPVAGPEVQAAVATALAAHGAHGEALIPILGEVNRALGYLPPEAVSAVAGALRATRGQVHAVATFYSLLSVQPRGRHVVLFCESAPCHVVGGREVWQALQAALKLAPGETSPDGRFTLLTTSCIGVCGVGPVVVIDDDVHGHLTPAELPALLERYA